MEEVDLLWKPISNDEKSYLFKKGYLLMKKVYKLRKRLPIEEKSTC